MFDFLLLKPTYLLMRSKISLRLSVVSVGLGLSFIVKPLLACIWDSDTIAMENSRFPGIAELITGSFPRHSREFYEWRKSQSEASLAKTPKQAETYDDLAVAQHKLGDHRGAIATMQAKDKALPGIYETYSNLGTFYIYTGELDEAARWIKRALEINPNAHFGREVYQLRLVEWLLAGKPQKNDVVLGYGQFGGFAAFLVERSAFQGKPHEWGKEREKALKGITGMMRFADYDNPVLLEALGDVLMVGDLRENASNLAVQSYFHASQRSKEEAEKKRLYDKMLRAGSTLVGFKPDENKRLLDAGLKEGAMLNKQVSLDEIAWIKAGKNVTAEFNAKYLKPAPKSTLK